MHDILVVIVNFFTEIEILQRIAPFSGQDVSFIIVDNGSKSRDALERLNALDNAEVIDPGSNLGYLNGAFYGIKYWENTRPTPTWSIVCNPDITFDLDFFSRLADMPTSGIAMLAPTIFSQLSRDNQNPKYVTRPDRSKLMRLEKLYRSALAANFYTLMAEFRRRIGLRRVSANGGSAIYCAQGSCMLLSREFIERLKPLHYPIFLFGEELFLAEQARTFGLETLMQPTLRVTHSEHMTIKKIRSRKIIKYQHESLKYLLAHHWN